MTPPAYSPDHVIALIKGTVEGDPYRHFGSLLGMASHMATAKRLGLLDADGKVTEAGLALYYDGGLRALPDGRANEWHFRARETLAVAVRMLEDWGR